jgi:hypothetical protein
MKKLELDSKPASQSTRASVQQQPVERVSHQAPVQQPKPVATRNTGGQDLGGGRLPGMGGGGGGSNGMSSQSFFLS